MAQKRCYGQQFRLRPDPMVVQICWYALAYVLSKEKYAIELHEAIISSNHDHINTHDPEAQRPAFLQEFHSLVARAVNA